MMSEHYAINLILSRPATSVQTQLRPDLMPQIHQVVFLVFRGSKSRSEEHPLLRLGHAGITFNGSTVYGFSPADEIINLYLTQVEHKIKKSGGSSSDVHEKTEKSLITELKTRGPVPGQVRNDSIHFDRARELYQERQDIPVRAILLSNQFTEDEFQALEDKVKYLVNNPTAPVSQYKLPDKPPYPGKPMPSGFDNCLTWPRTLGLEILEKTGYMYKIEAILDKKQATGEAWIW